MKTGETILLQGKWKKGNSFVGMTELEILKCSVCCPVEQSPSCPSTGGPQQALVVCQQESLIKPFCSKMALERTPVQPQCDPAWQPTLTCLAPRGNPEWFGLEGSFKGHQRIKSHLCWIFNSSIITKMGLLLRECWAQVQESTGWGWTVIPSLPWLCAGTGSSPPPVFPAICPTPNHSVHAAALYPQALSYCSQHFNALVNKNAR